MDPTPAQSPSDRYSRLMEGRRALDLAEGILVGLRRYSTDAAFDELVEVAHRNAVSVFAVAAALVRLASTTGDPGTETSPEAVLTTGLAQREWSGLLGADPAPGS